MFVAAGQPRGSWRRLSYRLFWAEAMACVLGLYLSARSIAPVPEIVPGAVFHAWIVVVTFISISGARKPLAVVRRPSSPASMTDAVVDVGLQAPSIGTLAARGNRQPQSRRTHAGRRDWPVHSVFLVV
jgi:hypothetical protein